jgi:S-layer protein (TIGR01567 family)
MLIAQLLIALLQLLGNSVAENASILEIPGEISTVSDNTISWNPQTFAGFYYDIDDDLGNEAIQMTITNGKLEEPNGVMYTTTSQLNDFEFEDWGWYNSIGFLGDNYFAGYSEIWPVVDGYEIDAELYRQSTDRNLLIDEQLLKVLKDDDIEMTVTSGTPLKLEEGYVLSIRSIDIDGNHVYLELSKNGSVVDSKVVSPSKDYAIMSDRTYYYRKDIGDTRDIVIIAAHFKNAFRGSDQILATVDGIFQVSDTVTDVEADTEFDRMRISSVSSDAISMDNKDNSIILSKNKKTPLMGNIGIKTADQDEITADNPLRFCIYKEITDPGTYVLRGQVQRVEEGATPSWTPQNFAGFYYDIDEDLGNEAIQMTITNGKLEESQGIEYTTAAQKDGFNYSDWGYYNSIGFIGNKYFAGYIQDDLAGTNPEILDGTNAVNLLDFGILTDILIDDREDAVYELSSAISLKEGYSLKLTIAKDKKGVLAELLRNKKVIDKKAVLLPGTYVYTSNIGDVTGVPLIAARLEEPIFLESKSYFKVNGIWQISENPMQVGKGNRYGIMTVSGVDSVNGVITMNNQDNSATLSKNKDTPLMGGLRIRTADQDDIYDANPLRFYIFKDVDIVRLEDGSDSSGGKA